MIASRPSALYRFAQTLRVLAILSLVFLVLFLATVAASAVQMGVGVAKQTGSLHRSVSAQIVGTDVLVNVTFPVPNEGYYNVRGLTLAAVFTNQTIQTGPLAVTTGGPTDIPGHGTGTLSLLTYFDMANPAGPFLLLHDAGIQGTLWLNASYAAVVPVNLVVGFNYHWGAPFANLSYSTGTPTPEPNMTVAIPVTIYFENHTPGLVIAGELMLVVRAPDGTVCTQQSFPVATHNGPVTLMETLYWSRSCPVSGDTISSSFVGPGIDIAFPTETIP